jgi:hypothetical protein
MTSSLHTADVTLALLEERLRRVQYILNGNGGGQQNIATQQPASATARLRTLERALAQLASRSSAAAEALRLQRAHPHIINPSAPVSASDLMPNQLAVLVLAHAQPLTSLSANLGHLQDTQLPNSTLLVKLVELQPRIENAWVKQEEQAREVAELRARSARVVEKWLEEGALGMSERWAEWEERVRAVEIKLRRREAVRRREEGAV